MSRAFLVPFVLATATLSTTALGAPRDKAGAKEAYDRGLEAHKRGDTHTAAEEFAKADSLAPSAIALRAALDATIDADDPALGAELLERSKREPSPPNLAASIRAAHAKFKGRAGRMRVVCPKGSSCAAKIDDKPVDVDKVVWARTGQRTVIIQVDGEAQTKLVEVSADQLVDVTASKGGPSDATTASTAAFDATTPESKRRRDGWLGEGLPPIYFYGGVGLTVVFAGMTTYFAIDTSSQHGDFKDAGCERANFPACASLASDGEGAQTRTNVSLVLTAISGIATAVVGAKLTNWDAPLFAVHPGGGMAGWRATF